jgi:hypothetical protein
MPYVQFAGSTAVFGEYLPVGLGVWDPKIIDTLAGGSDRPGRESS